MRDAWRRVALREVAALEIDRVQIRPDGEYPIAGVLNAGRGLFARDVIRGSQTTYPALHRLHSGDLVMRKLTAWEGTITTVPPEFDGYFVSPEFPTYRLSPELDPAFLRLVCQRAEFWEAMRAVSTGTVQRRKRVNPARLLTIGLDVPPSSEQKQIVDLLATADAAVAAAEAEVHALQEATTALLRDAFAGAPATRILGSLCEMSSGCSWNAPEEVAQPGDGVLPVVGIPATPAGRRWLDETRRTFVTGLPVSVRLLSDSSLVMIRTNGNRSRIGNVYRVPGRAVGSAYSAFQIGVFPFDRADSSYLFWFLSSPGVQSAISEAASGSTGLGNIAVSWLKRVEVPWPSEPERREVALLADSFDLASIAANRVLDRLRSLRSALLDDLLSGQHEIPGSYLRVLESAS